MAQPVFSYTNLTTSTGTVIKVGPAILAGMTINTKGTAGSSVQFRDGTSSSAGTTIATVDVGSAIGTLVYDIATINGLWVGSSSATADYTVEWA